MIKSPDNVFSAEQAPLEESDDSKRTTGRKFLRALFPDATRSLDQTYKELDYKLKVVGKDIVEQVENNQRVRSRKFKHTFRCNGKIYQSDFYRAEQMEIFVTAKDFVDLIDAPDRGEPISLDRQKGRVEFLIGQLDKIYKERDLTEIKNKK